MILGFIVLFSPVGEIMANAGSSLFGPNIYGWFFGIFGPVLLFQTIFHWYALNYLYSEKMRSNLIWVIFMPAFLIIGYIVVIFMIFVYTFSPD